MPRPREIFLQSANWLTRKFSLDYLIKRSGMKMIFPFYHVVSNEHLPHISHLYDYPDEKKFLGDLDFILKHFEPLHPDELENEISGNNKNKFLLSFDDGLREMYFLVAPILKRKGVPALFFLNSAFVDNRNLFYRYKISILIDKLKKGKEHDREFLLHLHYADSQVIQVYADRAGVDFRSYLAERKPYLTSEQIIEMSNDGFVFGGHSIDHPHFDELSLDEQLRQANKSVAFVEGIAHQEKKYFAFPFTDEGVGQEFFDAVKKENTIDFTFGTAGLKKISGNHIQRIPMEKSKIPAEELLKNEYAYFMMKKLAGR